MKNKGFTLVELLAVIVILSLLALLTTTSVTKLVEDSNEDISNIQLESIKSSAEAWGADNLNILPKSGECKYLTLEDLKNYGIVDSKTDETLSDELKIKITTTTSDLGQLITNYEVNPEDVEGCTAVYKKYDNGDAVYFDVTTGEKCNSEDAVSTTGTKSGCMKFYAFNDTKYSPTVNLILDHNTTASVAWNSSLSNVNGPNEVLTQLATDTSSWLGTETPSNYTLDQTEETSTANYTIDYSSYKARLITANEIAQIVGYTGWDESYDGVEYYLDSRTTTQTETSQGTSDYAWLFDYTNGCTSHGCNIADSSTYGYWTSSSFALNSTYAWSVHSCGNKTFYNVGDGYNYGVRPVIAVSKSDLE